MPKKKLKAPYVGPLSAAEIAQGIKCAQENALRLLDDAKLLRLNGRIPSASSLAILAIEERGKVGILQHMALVTKQDQIKESWRDYRTHRAKNTNWILPSLISGGAKTSSELFEAYDKDADHTEIIDTIKQYGFYTDTKKKGHWAEPKNIIDEKFCDYIISIADVLLKMKIPSFREIEAWRDIVGPHYQKPTMESAVAEWQKVMFSEGLSDIEPEVVESFLRGEPFPIANQFTKDAKGSA